MKLRTKTIIGIALIEALALGILIFSGLNWLKSSNEKSLELGSQQLVSVFAKASRDAVIATDLAYLDSFAQSVVSEHNLAYIRILNQDKLELTLQGDYEGVNTQARPFEVSDGVYDVSSVITLDGQPYGYVEMGVRVDGIHEILSLATQASFVIAIVEITLVALFSFALGTYLMNRLDILRKAVVKVEQHGPGASIDIKGNDEVTDVCRAFNKMSHSLNVAQQELEQEAEKQRVLSQKVSELAQVAEHARDVIIITNPDGKISWVNPAFEKLTGYAMQEAVGKSPGELLQGEHTSPDTVEQLSNSIKQREPIRVEILNYTKSREAYWVELDLSPVLDEQGELQRYIAVERDISDRREIEEKLSLALERSNKAAKAKSEFLANMSHEIRTPMNAIMGISELLVESEQRAEQKGLLQLLNKSANNLVTVINDILDYSKVEAGKLNLTNQVFDLRELVETCTSLCAYQADKKQLKLLVDMPLSLNSTVKADKGRVNQILLNLIGNAIKFTETGHVLLKVSEVEKEGFSFYQFDVIDTGIGIPEDRLPYIMEKFEQVDNSVTRKYEGTGLGLAISKRLIQMYDGELKVHSSLGKGSCFSFCLKLETQSEADKTSAKLKDCSVLYIDDYQPRVELFNTLASELELQVTHYQHLDQVPTQWATEPRFDRMLVNVQQEGEIKQALHLAKEVLDCESVSLLEPLSAEDSSHCINERCEVLHQPITHHKVQSLFKNLVSTNVPLETEDQVDLTGVNLLVAEDSSINRVLIEKMLDGTGVELTMAEDGVIAVDVYQQLKPDLVITDISMPNKDGYSVTKEIREFQDQGLASWCPIIAFSAHALLEDQEKGAEFGMDDYLTKPVQRADLLNMIAKWSSQKAS
ncbi:response regulator [Vibrio sp. D404a]|uniref:hybrid sensor histidine kinase/response regulator n=1 Tax=unclassified Vibrio TaxID=2614977 RepID=UPI002553EAA2|nr:MULTISPECIES: ATP-binding protein [unclassified Vibrio]MDK9737116.1 response regulator [Vibrio sp. D404a]MDK9798201.1 response regulator [Vibrio sp. D449a]